VSGIARYTWPTSIGRFSIQGDFSWTDDQFFDIANNPITHEDAYAVYNASVGYATTDGRYEVTAWIKNIADEEYRTYAIPVTSLGFAQNMYGKPRWYGVTLSARFGGQ
jgi:iron complex outermembrane receptor protein